MHGSVPSAAGRSLGGQPFARGSVFHLPRNRLYVGHAVHGEEVWPGRHDAIIELGTFDAVQREFGEHRCP